MFDPTLPSLFAAKLADPQQVLETVFGYREFRPGQRHIIDAVLRGQDCLTVQHASLCRTLPVSQQSWIWLLCAR